MTEGLKPCPFCGRNAKTRIAWDGMVVITCKCGAIVSFLENDNTPEKAISAWNRRDGNANTRTD